MHPIPVVTVDGPSGAGKGTLSALIAEKLGWHLLDSGAIYRVLAVAAMHHDLPVDDESAVVPLASGLDVSFEIDKEQRRVVLEGEDVTDDIRTEEVGAVASQIASLARVREALLRRQRAFQQDPGLVADGRDMGTVVFPGAALKIFLTASAEERVRVFRLAWDACCSAFASRQVLYERFFQGDAMRNAVLLYNLSDKEPVTEWVREFLEQE